MFFWSFFGLSVYMHVIIISCKTVQSKFSLERSCRASIASGFCRLVTKDLMKFVVNALFMNVLLRVAIDNRKPDY